MDPRGPPKAPYAVPYAYPIRTLRHTLRHTLPCTHFLRTESKSVSWDVKRPCYPHRTRH